MNLFGAWKKLLLFGLFGAAGCLAGWAVGEAYLSLAREVASAAGASEGPSLISSGTGHSQDPPLPNSDFQERLKNAGAHTGDVQISLIWFSSNDLDLHCVDPSGFEISWEHRIAPSGGELDVDRNANCRIIDPKPVENIYWPAGMAPMGRYQVLLDYFKQCDAGPNDSTYQISILRGGEREEIRGSINRAQTGTNKVLVREFNLKAEVRVLAPSDFQVVRGTAIRIPVAVTRSFFQGKLDLKAENLPDGVTAMPASIEAGKTDGVIELRTTNFATTGAKRLIKVTAASAESPDVHGSADVKMEVLTPAFSLTAVAVIGIWTAILALGLCLALVIGQNWYLGRPKLASGRIPLVVVIAGTLAAGFVSGSVGQSLYLLLLGIGASGLGFLVGWVLLGGLLGLGVSYFVPNLDRKKAMIAGVAGGLFGAIGYLVWSYGAEWLGRFAGAGLLGFCIGLMVAIVEAAFRSVWLEVRFGSRETIAVNLGPEPVKVGGDARVCTIWARGAPGVALRYFVRDGRVICEDSPARKEAVVANGDTRTIGTVTLVVHTGLGAAPRPLPRPPTLPAPASSMAGGNAPASAMAGGSAPSRPAEFTLPVAPRRAASTPEPAASPPKAVAPVASPAPPAAKPPMPVVNHQPPAAKPPAPAPKPPIPAAKPPVPVARTPSPASPPTAATKPPVPVTKPLAPVAKPPAPTAGAKPPAPAPPKPSSPAAPNPSKPPAPVPTAKPPVPTSASKPPPPVAPLRPPAAPPAAPTAPAAGAKPGNPNACPTCGRVIPGRPGSRFCMMCDKAY